MKFFLKLFIVLAFGCAFSTQDYTPNNLIDSNNKALYLSEKYNSYKVGDKEINIPLLSNQFEFIDEEYNAVMEIFIPPTNELLCGFILKTENFIIETGADDPLSYYAMVQYPKQQQYTNISEYDFKTLENEMKQMLGNGEYDEYFENSEDLLNNRLDKLDLSNFNVEIGEPVSLGTLIKKKNVYAFGMITPYKIQGNTITKSMLGILIRVKERIIFVYIYDDFNGKGGIEKIVDLGEDFADRILYLN